MLNRWLPFLLAVFPAAGVHAQTDWLDSLFCQADSVVLISHQPPRLRNYPRVSIHRTDADRPTVVTEATLRAEEAKMEKETKDARLLFYGEDSCTYIKERRCLSLAAADSLLMLMAVIHREQLSDHSLCYFPQQAILLYSQGRLFAAIDLCFHCQEYMAAGGLRRLNKGTMDARGWAALKDFFRQEGLSYQMD